MEYLALEANGKDLNPTIIIEKCDIKVEKKSRTTEKIVHLIAVLTIVFLTHATLTAQWLLPYYYSVATPFLIGIRFIMYWKNKWQYFMIDFCYFANILWYTYIWIPDQKYIFEVVFAVANGPILWAMVVYRNSVVFYSIDKMTSTYIHLLPPLLSYCVRWYPEETSKFWIKPFLDEFPEFSFIWQMAIPLAFFIAHSAFYYLVIHVLVKPSDDYLTSYNYLGDKEDTCLFKVFNICGSRWRCLMFFVFNWIFCLVSLVGVVLCYNFYIAHCIFIGVLCAITVWNGASYYMEVFGVRGLGKEAKLPI